MPKRWTSPPAAIASAQSRRDLGDGRRPGSRAARAALRRPSRYRVGSVLTSSSNEEDSCTVVGHRVSDARHGSDRPLLHENAARAAQPRPRPRRLLALRGAGARRSRATTASPSGRPTSRRRSRIPRRTRSSIGLPNHLHEEAVELCAQHGKAVLCTKPLARTAEEAKRMLDTVERAGVFAGYLEDLVYTPKTLKAVAAVQAGPDRRRALGALARDASRPAQRLVLGRGAGRRRRRSSTSAATASRSSATSSARRTGPSR